MCYTAGGKQRFESTGTKNKKLAQRLFALRQAEIIAGKWNLPVPSAPKLGEWCDKFIESIPVESTRTRYTASIKRLCQFYDRKTPLQSISTRTIEDFKTERLRGVGPSTTNRDLVTLRSVLRRAINQGLITQDPFVRVRLLNERPTRRNATVIDFQTEERILACASPLLRAVMAVELETGLRIRKECLKLQWSDIDFDRGTLTVRTSKTAAGIRSLPISNHLKRELLDWKRLTANTSKFVFFNPTDHSKPLGSLRKTWSTTLRKAGVKYFPIYHLRATFASRLSAAGVADSFVSQMLGHAGGLLQTYSKATQPFQREAIAKLESLRNGN